MSGNEPDTNLETIRAGIDSGEFVELCWRAYAAASWPDGISPEQEQIARNIYFSGAYQTFGVLVILAGSAAPEDVTAHPERIRKLAAEFDAFFAAMEAGEKP